jgi:4-amino-4-deoxy-L-arabinose transferase-like glycosyltransferase
MPTPSPTAEQRAESRLTAALRSATLAVIAAYALRMLLFFLSHHWGNPLDPKLETVGEELGMVAGSIATGHGFSTPFPGYATATGWLAPVFPYLAAIGYKIFHLDPYSALLFCQIMNCTFSAAICWPIYALGKEVFGPRIGLAAAWVWVFLPYAVLMPLEWTWDQSLSALLLSLLIWATYRLREEVSSRAWFGYGLLWAFSALTNPALCGVLPFLLGWLIIERRRKGLAWARMTAKAVFIFVLALLPWTARNYFTLDGFVFVKSNFGLELWLGNNPAVKEIYSPELHPSGNFRQRILLIMNGEPNYNRIKEHEAIAFIRAHPKRFLQLSFERFVDTWAATYDSTVDPWIHVFHLEKADVWFCSIFSILALAGILLALEGRIWDSLPLIICMVIFPIPYYITHTAIRYRHPIDPVMTILAVYAIGRLGFALVPQREPVAAPAD